MDIHFNHVKSSDLGARALPVPHGWPGSVVEFHQVIKPLTDPQPHGGNAQDAFHVICPSLSGYGFSGKPVTTGWSVDKIAKIWNCLMVSWVFALSKQQALALHPHDIFSIIMLVSQEGAWSIFGWTPTGTALFAI